MKQQKLITIWRRKFVKTTDSKHKMSVAANVSNQEFNPTQINKSWVADINYIQTGSG